MSASPRNIGSKGDRRLGNDKKTAVVVSAHSADFVWRAGGAIALHAAKGWEMHVVCLSFGERGESARLWRQAQGSGNALRGMLGEHTECSSSHQRKDSHQSH